MQVWRCAIKFAGPSYGWKSIARVAPSGDRTRFEASAENDVKVSNRWTSRRSRIKPKEARIKKVGEFLVLWAMAVSALGGSILLTTLLISFIEWDLSILYFMLDHRGWMRAVVGVCLVIVTAFYIFGEEI